MLSTKKQVTNQNQQRNKVVTAKGKGSILLSRLDKDKQTRGGSAAIRSFEVYTENENADVDSGSRKPIPVNKGSTLLRTSCQKGGLKNMGMSKAKNYSSAKTDVGRRALADLSNTQSTSSRNAVRLNSKPRVSLNLGTRNVNVPSTSRKSVQGKIQGSLGRCVSDLSTSKRVGIKDLKAPSDNQRIKAIAPGLKNKSTVTNVRRTTRNSFIPTRKSLPVLKMVNEAEIPKEEARSSEKSIEESGCPVKGKVGRIVAPRVNNGRTNLWRNRVSDGFIITGRTSGDSRTLSRKSVRPIVKTTLKTSNVRNNTMSKNTSGPNKLITAATTSKEAVKSSASENIIQESTHGQLPSDGNSIPSTSDTNARKSSNRRKSYTLLLVERSKLLEENDEGLQQEKLPSIDDERNQLEVSDYVDEIYQYYWVTEAQNPPRANYMTIQTDITPQMRSILINWLIEVHFKFDLMQETLYLTVTLLDRFLSEVTIKKNEMQLVGLTSLLLASKYEDFWHPRVKELISISAESYTRDQMLEMEKLILKKLKFRLNTPTPYVFMLRFLKAAQSDTKVEHLAFYLIELCLLEYEALTFKPSLLCASAIYVARCTLRMTPPWTPLLSKHARYDVSQMRECAEMMLRLQKTARVGQLKVTYEKYMRSDLSVVAAIKPLEKLPL